MSAAARDLLQLDFSGARAASSGRLADWLSGPAKSYWTIPLNAAGVVILVYVVVRGRRFDPWLRLIGAAALAQHAVALVLSSRDVARYHFLTWLLTLRGGDGLFLARLAIALAARALSRRLRSASPRIRVASGLHPASRGCKK